MERNPRIVRTLSVVIMVIALVGCGGDAIPDPTSTSRSSEVTAVATKVEVPPNVSDEKPSASPLSTSQSRGESTPISSNVSSFVYPTPGGGEAFDSNHDGDLTWEEYQLAVAAAIDAFPWPPSYHVTPEIVVAGFKSDPANTSALFQVGFELNNVSVFWNCAWFQTWLDARKSGESALEAQALDYIVNSMPQSVGDDYSRSVITSIGDKAMLGDPSGVIQMIKANNCAARLSTMQVATPKP